ncbi:MAG: hypothetical protein Q7J30_01275 [Candidatus Azambacteria bacterium]|nr:hypothetical protein [Candidatus Azambacteria bacterium]
MNRNTKIVVVILIIALIVATGFFAYKKYFPAKISEISKNGNVQPLVENNATTQPKTDPLQVKTPKTNTILSGYTLYKNADFGFEIQYPDLWAVSEENIENVRGENTKAFYFSPMGGSASGGKKSESDLRFVILPRDGLSYGLPYNGVSSEVLIGGSAGAQQKWTLPDGKRLWLLYPKYGLRNWSEDIGRIDIQSSATDPAGDTVIFEKMLNSFKLAK